MESRQLDELPCNLENSCSEVNMWTQSIRRLLQTRCLAPDIRHCAFNSEKGTCLLWRAITLRRVITDAILAIGGGALLHKQTRVYGPYFRSKGHLVRQKSQKKSGLRVRNEILHKKGVFRRWNSKQNVTNLDGNLSKFRIFEQTCYFFIK